MNLLQIKKNCLQVAIISPRFENTKKTHFTSIITFKLSTKITHQKFTEWCTLYNEEIIAGLMYSNNNLLYRIKIALKLKNLLG